MDRPKLGIALGGGGARGWAHFGVLRALGEHGLEPDCIAGTSVGSLIGAAAATGQLGKLERWVRALTRTDVLKLLDARFRGGMIQGNRLMSAIEDLLADHRIEDLEIRYGAVATDMYSGRELWLREGSMIKAVRASCALPGLFSPIRYEGRWLIDGGVVNPVPVSVCYALGADVVIAVNLNAPHVHRHPRRRETPQSTRAEREEEQSYLEKFRGLVESWLANSDEPGMLEVLSAAIGIMQERITRSRLAGEPPHLEIHPRSNLELMEFHRADEAIEAGRKAVAAAQAGLDELGEYLLG
jgi:NTE family protein